MSSLKLKSNFVSKVAAHCATLENKEGQQKGAEITSATSKGNAGIHQANKIVTQCPKCSATVTGFCPIGKWDLP